MTLPLTARIAARYLRAKKSHSAVTAISAVSIAGIAVATAAIVCVLSVFNGFKEILVERLDSVSPDIELTPARGKVFANADSMATVVGKDPDVALATPVVADNALAIYEGREVPVTLKGVVEGDYAKTTAIRKLLLEGGTYSLSDSTERTRRVFDPDVGDYIEEPMGRAFKGVLSVGAASKLGSPLPGEQLLVFAPRREGHVNLANPSTSFMRDSVTVSAIFQSGRSDVDDNYVITDIGLARDLLSYTTEATGIEARLRDGANAEQVARRLEKALGPSVVAKDRLQQQEINFRMISIEKWVSFLLLAFILVVASFNIISTLSMLVLEKQSTLSTLRALGMTRRRIGAVFAWEGLFVTLAGCLGGVALGLLLCLLQQHLGLIKLGGDPSKMLIHTYPVVVKWIDLLAVLLPISLIGAVAARIASRFAQSRITLRQI